MNKNYLKKIVILGCLGCLGLLGLFAGLKIAKPYLFSSGPRSVPLAPAGGSSDRFITFYGKVVDQDGKPVSNATVRASYDQFNLEEHRTGHTYTPKPLEATTNFDGKFFFPERRIHSLTILDVAAPGCTYRQDLYPNYYYDPSISGKVHIPNPAAPEVFTMWHYKGSCDRLRPWKAVYRPPAGTGGTCGLYLRNPALMDEDLTKADVVFRMTHGEAIDPEDRVSPRGQHDWSLVIEVPDGGIVETKDYYMFEAPEASYARRYELKVKVGDPDWSEEKVLKFYVRCRGGKYVTAMKVTATVSSFPYTFDIIAQGYTNLNGSRNLQVDPENLEPLGGK